MTLWRQKAGRERLGAELEATLPLQAETLALPGEADALRDLLLQTGIATHSRVLWAVRVGSACWAAAYVE